MKLCQIVYSEAAITHRRSVVRGFHTVQQSEHMHVIMAPETEPLQSRPNKNYPGSSSGDMIGLVGPPIDHEHEWKMTFVQKKLLYGPDGRTVDTEQLPPTINKSNRTQREDSDVEPVHYWQMTSLLYQEIIHRLQGKAVIDLTATDTFALVCIELGIPYLGICHTGHHVDFIKRRLSSAVFNRFTTENNPLYKTQLAQTVHKATAEIDHLNTGNPKAKAKSKAKAKAKAKPKAKKGKGKGEEGEDGEEGADDREAEGEGEDDCLDDEDGDLSGDEL